MTNAQRIVEGLEAEVERLREEAEGQEERVSKWRNLAYDKAREVERLRGENEELRNEVERLREAAEAVLRQLEGAPAYYDQDWTRYRTVSDDLIASLRAAVERKE